MSVIAGAIGLALVMIIMLVVFGMLGLIADLALLLYVQIVLWLMAGFGAVLTLPGIAGIILSIGMAVDSNVIIFTRIKEEIKKGKSVRVAADMGFKSALTTVIDAQTTTLIASIVLYLIGTSSVKGFALTLMLGTLCSIITAVFVTQLFVNILSDSKKFATLKHFGIKEDGTPRFEWKKHVDFVGKRKVFYCISIAIIAIGIGFAGIRGFNMGIDFTGGTMIQMEMGKTVDIDEVKDTVKEFDLDPTIVYAGDGNTQIILKSIKALKSAERTEVVNAIEEKYNLGEDSVLASEEFGPSVGNDLKANAVKAVLIATLCMLIYIRFRFKTWKFGVVGYSINDTIVVFDRIRENSKFYKRKQDNMLVNDSVNQTLSRSIMTSLTTLIVMVPLFFMVSTQIREFLVPLIIGVLVGTYSSICLCSPMYYAFKKKENMSSYTIKKESDDKSRAKANKKNNGDK